jgi:ATP-binding cassette subfamily F protein 3
MPLIGATNIAKAFGETIVLEGVSLSIEAGERVGLVGRNGSGKSTLMKILGAVDSADSGDVAMSRGRSAGYLKQDPDLDPNETLRSSAEGAFAVLHALHHELNDVFEAMGDADGAALDKLMKRQVTLEKRIEAAGGYTIDHKIDEVLHGLGFVDAQFSIPVSGLSGGQKSRLALARLLLQEPDLLLLDEPTNHLDIEGRLWLESFLKVTYRGAVLMISHDRYLLDAVVTRIIEVEQARLIDYPGNYAQFREIRAERREAQLRAYENQQTKFKSEAKFIQKYKAGQRAKQAKGRESRLEREKRDSTLERPVELASFRMEFPKAPRSGDIVAHARGVGKWYDLDDGSQKHLFDDLTVAIERGERWGVIGPNGAGKTTLVRCVLGEMGLDAGSVKLGSNVNPGYFSQDHTGLDDGTPVYRAIQRIIQKENPGGELSEQAARNLAGAFLFSGDEQEKEVRVLSGGERARVVMAGLLASAKNLLILDEPTNHLDVVSAERLEEALRYNKERKTGYDGTLIVISHDRALIDATCDNLIVLDGAGGVEVFIGNYTMWHEREVARSKERSREKDTQRKSKQAQDKKDRAVVEQKRQADAAQRGPSNNAMERMKTGQLEKKIEQLETRIKAIDVEMGEPDVWSDAKRCGRLGDERATLIGELEPLEFEWMRRTE